MSFADDLAVQAVARGVGAEAVNIFVGSGAILPTPQQYPAGDATKGAGPYLVIVDTGGLPPTRVQNAQPAHTKRPTAQVLATAQKATDALTMALAAYAAIDGIFNVVVNGTWYLRIAARQEPTDIGKDQTGRNEQIVFNVEAEAFSS